MSNAQPSVILETDAEPPTVQRRAIDNLAYIRQTMESAAAFTHVSGWGMVAVGVLTFVAHAVAQMVAGEHALFNETQARRWLAVWLVQAVLSACVAAWLIYRKVRKAQAGVLSTPGKKMLLGFAPPMFAGAMLTAAFAQLGLFTLLPGMWMLLYGVGVATGGAYSVRTLPAMGAAFIALGSLALFLPPVVAIYLMTAGFGGLHILFGFLVIRRHGG